MEFTYHSYSDLIEKLSGHGYQFCRYTNCEGEYKKCILRHDIDMDLKKAAEFAEFEEKLDKNVHATYFVLICSDFYNIYSKQSMEYLDRICRAGHEIGLHFDELRYAKSEKKEIQKLIMQEAELLETMVNRKITAVSMHRPSTEMLNADLELGGVINSYQKKFFHEFKYLSDSRMQWREDVLSIVEEEKYRDLHILTHPFWYEKGQESFQIKFSRFFTQKNRELYHSLYSNVTNLEDIFHMEELNEHTYL